MKILRQTKIEKANIPNGEFNNCEHLFVEIEPGECQTISCKLPNGKFVTFGFVPSSQPNEFECVDLHHTISPEPHWQEMRAEQCEKQYPIHVVGFGYGGSVFDSRNPKHGGKPPLLATILLRSDYYLKTKQRNKYATIRV